MHDDGARPIRIVVDDLMQHGREYVLTAPAGEEFGPGFEPELRPQEMLALGVFGGKYLTDCRDEFPEKWFEDACLCPDRHDPALNRVATPWMWTWGIYPFPPEAGDPRSQTGSVRIHSSGDSCVTAQSKSTATSDPQKRHHGAPVARSRSTS